MRCFTSLCHFCGTVVGNFHIVRYDRSVYLKVFNQKPTEVKMWECVNFTHLIYLNFSHLRILQTPLRADHALRSRLSSLSI